jgi:hypothetical protein
LGGAGRLLRRLHRRGHLVLGCHHCLPSSISLTSADRGVPRLAHVSASRSRSPGRAAVDLLDLFLVVELDAGRSPSRAIASCTRSGNRSDRTGLLWSGGHQLAGCSDGVGHQLPARAAATRDRGSTRLACALPHCVPSAS